MTRQHAKIWEPTLAIHVCTTLEQNIVKAAQIWNLMLATYVLRSFADNGKLMFLLIIMKCSIFVKLLKYILLVTICYLLSSIILYKLVWFLGNPRRVFRINLKRHQPVNSYSGTPAITACIILITVLLVPTFKTVPAVYSIDALKC